jgi:hypothetical protein
MTTVEMPIPAMADQRRTGTRRLDAAGRAGGIGRAGLSSPLMLATAVRSLSELIAVGRRNLAR